jgi:glycosyltransferase involved in cell wall biosynthesis
MVENGHPLALTRRRVLVVQPSLQPPGGGNGVAAWALQALQGRHDVGLLTWTPVDVGQVNRFYGTSVQTPLAQEHVTNALTRGLLDSLPFSLALIKHALLQRRAQELRQNWDVLLSVNNETCFGQPGIQYVHYPNHKRPRPREDVHWYHGPSALLDGYYALADRIGRVSRAGILANVTLVNSDWTARAFHELHGIYPQTVYPPTTTDFADVPWRDRIDGFLCLGRIAPEKDIHRVIDILSLVRRQHPRVTLRLVGSLYPGRYSRSVERRVRQEADWISLDTDLTRQALIELLPRYRYGIHGMAEEHFGMAPAEMVAAGCIVFVPNGGGQVEIVGTDLGLTYDGVDDAVARISGMLADEHEQARTRQRLATRVARFSTAHFMQTICDIVEQFPAAPRDGSARRVI